MNLASVVRHLGLAHLVIAIATLLPLIFALRAQSVAWVGFAITGFCAVFVAGLAWAATVQSKQLEVSRAGLRELMLSLLLFWCVTPIVSALPFVLDRYTFAEAWFEAVSALTTTGAWLSEPIARSTAHDMVYRASLQWVGGLVSMATAAAIFIRPEFIGVNPAVPPFARGESDSYLSAFDSAFRNFFPVYAVITGAGFVAFCAFGVPGVEALTMALSLTASGGFIPHQAGMAAYGGGAHGVASVSMVLSAVNFILIASIFLGQTRRIERRADLETIAFFALIPMVALLLWLSHGAGDVAPLGTHIFNAISLLSTNGFIAGGETPGLVPVLVTVMIGGAAVSTAGGIKLLRWLVTFNRLGQQLWTLIHPGAVLRHRGAADEFGVWIHAIAFAVLTGSLVLTVAFFGFSLETSAAAAVAVISNAGPVIELAPQMTADYQVFDPALRMILSFGMIAGRFELVMLLVALNRAFWRG